MDRDRQEVSRRTRIAEMQLALQAAIQTLDDLDARVAERTNTEPAISEPINRLVNQIALGMTKAGSRAEIN